MKINCSEFGDSYPISGIDYRKIEWGFGKLGEDDDDFFNTMEFSCNGFVDLGEITILPEDPFCMTLNSISDWFIENQIDLLVSESHEEFGDHSLFKSLKINGFEGFSEVTLPEDPFCMKVRSTLNTISDWFHNSEQKILSEPHEAFELVLPYLDMEDLLSLEGVCKSLRDSIRKETFLWRDIEFDDFVVLKYRVSDDSLLKLTQRSQGNLHCLNLGGCVGITDNGLMLVLASNPHLSKLSISGCLGLTTSGMLSTLRNLKLSNNLGIKSLTTGGTLYFTKEQFQELNLLLKANVINTVPKSMKQRLYTSRRSDFLEDDDDRVIDLEICPLCNKPSLVFDCPLKDHYQSSCRACVVCIERCHDCGSCLMDCGVKPFCFAFSCVVCYKKRSV